MSSQASSSPSSANRAAGKAPRGAAAASSSRATVSRRAAATATPCSAIRPSSAVEPGRIGRALVGEETGALAHRLLIGRDAMGVRRIEPIDQPVEKAAPRRRRLGEQPVHLRRQPDDAEMLGQGGLRARRAAVDLHDAALAGVARGVAAGADLRGAARTRYRRRDRPGARRQRGRPRRRHAAVDLAQAGAAQAAAGARNDTASSRLVLPAPLGPVSTTGRGSKARRAAA